MSLLNCNGLDEDSMREKAVEYWVGDAVETFDSEVLVFGNFEVLRVLEKGEFAL